MRLHTSSQQLMVPCEQFAP